MPEITAAAVKSLRDRTGAGLMDCKRALAEAEGDEERAIDLLRQRGAAKAAKRAGREAREGTVAVARDPASGSAAMAIALSETDFVARNDEFVTFANKVAARALDAPLPAGEVIDGAAFLAESRQLQEELDRLRASMGENIQLGAVVRFEARPGEPIGTYVHFDNRVGVLAQLGGADGAPQAQEIADDVALHVAATNPLGVSEADIPEDVIARERKVLIEQAKGEGKPAAIAEKIVEGRMRKFFEQNALVWQAFVKDPDVTIRDVLERGHPGLEVLRFARLGVGD